MATFQFIFYPFSLRSNPRGLDRITETLRWVGMGERRWSKYCAPGCDWNRPLLSSVSTCERVWWRGWACLAALVPVMTARLAHNPVVDGFLGGTQTYTLIVIFKEHRVLAWSFIESLCDWNAKVPKFACVFLYFFFLCFVDEQFVFYQDHVLFADCYQSNFYFVLNWPIQINSLSSFLLTLSILYGHTFKKAGLQFFLYLHSQYSI